MFVCKLYVNHMVDFYSSLLGGWMDGWIFIVYTKLRLKTDFSGQNKRFSKILRSHQQGAVQGHRCFYYSLIRLILPLGKLLAFEIDFELFCDFHHCC